jgi:hypothetical protein
MSASQLPLNQGCQLFSQSFFKKVQPAIQYRSVIMSKNVLYCTDVAIQAHDGNLHGRPTDASTQAGQGDELGLECRSKATQPCNEGAGSAPTYIYR